MAFLDDLSKNISESSQLSADTMLLNKLIKDEESRIDSIYRELGKAYYEKHLLDCEVDFLNFITEIKNSCKKIDDYNQQIITLNNMVACPNCANLVPKGTAFCTKCGTRVEPIVAADNSQPICKKCGAILKEGMAFCSSCGAKAEFTPVQNVSNARLCTNCGAALKDGARFCVKCGTKVENTTPVAPVVEPVAPVVEPVVPVVESAVEPVVESVAPIVEPIQPSEPQKTEETNGFVIKGVCKNCGADLKEGARFCIKCGAKTEETVNTQAQNTEPQKKHCANCGKQLSDTARFCTGCGAKI